MPTQNVAPNVADAVRAAHIQRRQQQRADGRESLQHAFAPIAFVLWVITDVVTATLAVNLWMGGRGSTSLPIYIAVLVIAATLLSVGRIALTHWADDVPTPVLGGALALFALNCYANAEGAYVVAAWLGRPLEDSWFMLAIVLVVELAITTFLEFYWLDPLIRSRGAKAARNAGTEPPRRSNGGVR